MSSNLFAGRRVLAVFPHPDDESWAAGGLLQRAPEVHLVTLSRGEAGRDHRDGLTGPALAARRGGELHAACATLGLAPARLLDLPDGAIDRDVAAAALTPIVNELSPELVITFDHDGGYGHVDHVATCEATLEAVRRAAPTACVLACAFAPDLLAPLRAAFAQRHPELLHPAFATTPLGSERADLVLTLTRDEARAKRRALTAHASQMRHPGDAGPDRFLGPGVFQRLCRAERYVLLAGRPWW